MKQLSIVVGIAFLSLAAFASSEINSRDYTCAQLQSMLQSQSTLFINGEWYVNSNRECGVAQYSEIGLVPSSDNQECRIGYTCHDDPFGG